MSSAGAVARAAVPISNARAEASRKNGAKSRGPRTPEGKARSAQNALKHGLRADRHVVLPKEDAAEFADLEAAMVEDLAPVGALQIVLARRVVVAAWRLARADRIEAELFVYRCRDDGNLAIGLMRDGNGTRSVETLLRYRGAAQAELTRALRTLKALQAEQAAGAGLPGDPRRSRAAERTQATPPTRISACPEPQPPGPCRKPSGAGPRSNPKEPEPHPKSARPGPDRRPPEPGAPWNPAEPEVTCSHPIPRWLARARSSGSKPGSMPSGPATKTAS
jgi:hypothetical protein